MPVQGRAYACAGAAELQEPLCGPAGAAPAGAGARRGAPASAHGVQGLRGNRVPVQAHGAPPPPRTTTHHTLCIGSDGLTVVV